MHYHAFRTLQALFLPLLTALLSVLWALGLMTSYTLGGLLHILLVVAIILFLVHVIQGRSIADS